MDLRANFLALILLDALEDENEADVCTILERNAVDAGYVPQERGIAPIHYACGMENERMSVELTRRFLERGTDANVLTCDNMTPLHVAAIYGRLEVVSMLLQYGAKLDIYDSERKTAVHYAIEECHFEVVQIMRDHIFLDKYERMRNERPPPPPPPPHNANAENEQSRERQQQQTEQQQQQTSLSQSKFEHSIKQRATKQQSTSTPVLSEMEKQREHRPVNKNLMITGQGNDGTPKGKYTPNRVHYNYDVTSPYYINITHRRHKPQPLFPAIDTSAHAPDPEPTSAPANEQTETRSGSMPDAMTYSSPETSTRPVNIFSLTQRNVEELSHNNQSNGRSRASLIDVWRERVQNSRQPLPLHEYDDIGQMIDQVVANDHLDFTNVALKAKPSDGEADSGACGSTTSLSQVNDADSAPLAATSPQRTPLAKTPQKGRSPLGNLLLKMAASSKGKANAAADSSYATVPEFKMPQAEDKENRKQVQIPQVKITATDVDANGGGIGVGAADDDSFIRSPSNAEYFMQMTEAYVHTDDENGLVFYETKLLSNPGNKVALLRQSPQQPTDGMNATMTSQSTNLTLPSDYETDALRAELTVFGEPPGPITKSTKRLYIKRLIKYKRRKVMQIPCAKNKSNAEISKYSIELSRTVRSVNEYERIAEFVPYVKQTAEYFANHENKRQMREGHLKQSFIYMLIDPRMSCNLPGESVFLDKFEVWKRFLQSIFYVGKGKTSRPYSHLYAAMKTHSRLHSAKLAKDNRTQTQNKMLIRKEKLNVDLFKSAPTCPSDSKKLDRILDIWSNSVGVVCLHVFHNIMPTEAYTREAAIIDALGLQHLTNVKRGDYYGPARTWTMREKKYLGIALLYKAMQIYLAEGESQLSPSDLI